MDRSKIKFDIVKTRNIWFIVSLLVIGAGVASLFIRGLNEGVDFTGGLILRYKADKQVTTSEIDAIIGKHGLEHNPPQILAGGTEFIVRTASYGTPEQIAAMSQDERKEQAAALNTKINELKIDLNLEVNEIDPENFVLYHLPEKLERDGLNEVLSGAGFASETVTIAGTNEVPGKDDDDPSTYNVTLKLNVSEEAEVKKLAGALYRGLEGGYRQFEQEDTIDPVFGVELKKKAYISLLIATIGILLYVTIRFEFWFALAAIIALIHDCLITLGFYSILQLQVNSSFVAIILTVFGYSINDTIVIFDRIRENMRKDKKAAMDVVMNVSLWETMPRSINTVLTTEVTILAIMILGGASIKDIALGLSIGILSGCYSSILVAAPVAYIFKTLKGAAGERAAVAPPAAAAPKKADAGKKTKAQPAADQKKESQSAAANSAASQADDATAKKSSGGSAKSKKKGKQRRR